MRRHRITAATALSLALAIIGAACGDDDGADVRDVGDCGGSGSASASASASSAATESGSAASGSDAASCPSGSGSGSGSGSESGAGSGSGIADVEGAERGFALLAPAIEAEDATLVTAVEGLFGELDGQLGAYRGGGGYLPYAALTEEHKTRMQTTLAELSEHLAKVAGVLGLEE